MSEIKPQIISIINNAARTELMTSHQTVIRAIKAELSRLGLDTAPSCVSDFIEFLKTSEINPNHYDTVINGLVVSKILAMNVVPSKRTAKAKE